MTEPAPLSTIRTQKDPALLGAWKRFYEYDIASRQRKNSVSRVRLPIIGLIFLASFLAVLITYQTGTPLGDFLDQKVAGTTVFKFAEFSLIIVPLLAAGLMTYAYQFSPSVSWVGFRLGAEYIRYQTYLYRLEAGEYSGKNEDDQRTILRQHLERANDKVNELGYAGTYLLQDHEVGELAAIIPHRKGVKQPSWFERIIRGKRAFNGLTDHEQDDGFDKLTMAQYIEYRVEPQTNWYIKQTARDYKSFRRWRIAIIVVTGLSSLLAAMKGNWAPMVAVTTAATVALTMYIELRMYGRTYAIYHTTAQTLLRLKHEWQCKSADLQKNPAEQAVFVDVIEATFQKERELWMQQVVQAQVANEQALMRSLGQTPGNMFQQTNLDTPPASNKPDHATKPPVSGQASSESQKPGAGNGSDASMTVGGQPFTPVTPPVVGSNGQAGDPVEKPIGKEK